MISEAQMADWNERICYVWAEGTLQAGRVVQPTVLARCQKPHENHDWVCWTFAEAVHDWAAGRADQGGYLGDCIGEVLAWYGAETDPACDYCGRELQGILQMSDCEQYDRHLHEVPVPPVDDDEAWAREAKRHEGDCEWVETRAHRIEPRS